MFGLSDDELRTRLGKLFAEAQSIAQQQLEVIAEIDGRALPIRDGATSTVSWLRDRLRISGRHAKQMLRLARALADPLTATAHALARSAINVEQAGVIERVITELPSSVDSEVRSDAEGAMIRFAGQLEPRQLEIIGRRILHHVAPEVAEQHQLDALEHAESRAWGDRTFNMSQDNLGRVRLSGWLDTESAAVVSAAIDSLSSPLRPPSPDATEPAPRPDHSTTSAPSAPSAPSADTTASGPCVSDGGSAAASVSAIAHPCTPSVAGSDAGVASDEPADAAFPAAPDQRTVELRSNGFRPKRVNAAVPSPRREAPDEAAGGHPCTGEASGSGAHARGWDDRTPGQRRADALVEVCRMALASGRLPASGGLAPQLIVTMRYEPWRAALSAGQLDNGQQVTPATVRRIACDAGIMPVVLGTGGQILDMGRQRRLFTGPIRKALIVRDGGCSFPACDRPPTWTEAHHIRSWLDGGETSVDNGVLVCRLHHRLIHQGDWRVRLGADRLPEFIPPRYIDPAQVPRRNQYHRRT